jgi:hypothetical protein
MLNAPQVEGNSTLPEVFTTHPGLLDSAYYDEYNRCAPFFRSNIRRSLELNPNMVLARPSTGGIIIGQFSAVELDYLGIPRFEPANSSPDAVQEDELCTPYLATWGSVVASLDTVGQAYIASA